MTDTAEKDPAFVEVKENRARDAAREMVIGSAGVVIKDWSQLVDLAKYMAGSAHAVAKPLRGNVGICMAIIDQATRWGFSPWQLGRQAYVVNDILAFDSQTIHAIVEKFAPIKYRLRPVYSGEGEDRRCKIIGHFKGELDPLEYESPAIRDINPKNSPLWKTDPDQQLFYFATRRWARRYCPDILLGAYSVDELQDSPSLVPEHVGFERARDVTPRLAERLRERAGDEGFAGEQTIAAIDNAIKEASEASTE